MPGQTLVTFCHTTGKVYSTADAASPALVPGVPNDPVSGAVTTTLWTNSSTTCTNCFVPGAGKTILTRPAGFATAGTAYSSAVDSPGTAVKKSEWSPTDVTTKSCQGTSLEVTAVT